MSVECWKIEKDLCRCCHSEGSHKNLTESCLQGEEEKYSDMLHETLDINISPVTGPLCTVTYTICEVCIMRLQDAWSFKQQVLQCENRFKDLYTKNFIKLDPDCVVVSVKEEAGSDDEGLKEERLGDSDDDFNMAFGDDNISNESDMDMDTQEKTAKGKPKAKAKAKVKAAPKAAPKKTTKPTTKSAPSTDGQDEGQAKEKKGDDEEPIVMPYILDETDGVKQYICSCCQKVFLKLANFSQHYKCVHLKMRKKLRGCFLCSVKVTANMRAKHMEEAHGVERPQCLACGRKFSYPFQVIHHQKTFHMNEKPYACSSCDMRFGRPAILAKHARKHSSDRPFSCQYCDKSFRWKKNLATHEMAHRDERRQRCALCDAAFVQVSSLKYHIAKKHPDTV